MCWLGFSCGASDPLAMPAGGSSGTEAAEFQRQLAALLGAAGDFGNKLMSAAKRLAREGAIQGGLFLATDGLGSALEFGSATLLESHFAAHGAEFGAKNAAEYLLSAQNFFSSGNLETLARGSDRLFYNSATREFGVVSSAGVIRTYFKAKPGYWLEQMARWGK